MPKACVVKSGPKKGKLKKGYRFGRNGSCVKAKSGTSPKRRGAKRAGSVSCKYGKLKNPTKRRTCKKKPGGSRRRR